MPPSPTAAAISFWQSTSATSRPRPGLPNGCAIRPNGSAPRSGRRAYGSIAGIGDVEAQTRQVCKNLKAAVEEAGGTLDDVVRVDVYVRNMEHFDSIHKVRREYFKAPAPASTMVEVCKMTSPDYLIEINAIAVLD